MPEPSASRSTRLGVDDWTAHALQVLISEGVGALKVARLCRDLGVTKGSFYWHFTDVAALMAAVADRWCTETRTALSGLSELERLPALERIRMMALRLVDDGSWQVERALREWAQTDTAVATVIRDTDLFIFELVQSALLELGYDATAARLRAGLLVYAGIGFAHGQQALPKPTKDDIEDLVQFISGESPRN